MVNLISVGCTITFSGTLLKKDKSLRYGPPVFLY